MAWLSEISRHGLARELPLPIGGAIVVYARWWFSEYFQELVNSPGEGGLRPQRQMASA